MTLTAELVAGQNAPFHVPHLHDPVTLGFGRERSATVGPPARTPDREIDETNPSVFMKPDMTDYIAGPPACYMRPEFGACADGERVRPSDELSVDDIGSHAGACDR